jgi:hypothetical protein
VANAIPKSTVTAKGDLLVATGASTPANLAVGSDGSTLVANSASATGMAWAGPIYTAGKNFVINGGFDIWQRGTSFSGPVNGYAADRWRLTADTGNVAWSQETSIVPTGARYAFTATATGGAVQPYFLQAFETSNTLPLAGKTVTLSAFVASSSSTSVEFNIYYSTNVDNGFSGTAIGAVTKTTTTTMPSTPQSAQFSIPSNAKSIYIQIRSAAQLTTGNTMTVGQVQLELGSVATAFSRAAGTLQGELAAAQRYYAKSYAQGIAVPTNSQAGNVELAPAYGTVANNAGFCNVKLPVIMRTQPSIAIYSFTNSTANVVTNNTGTDLAASSGLVNYNQDRSFGVYNNSGAIITPTNGAFIFHWAASAEL